ncbi:TPA: DUF4949 domain-containing protein [Legionella pneumophila]|nr:DUF4949 domain-containing protein [Legionella pneumophila]HAT3977615.1 DUF4949 domain-containing protein [Legionella pneumophila]HAT8358257.1 DUF4949 domain-containing protein [Legionella pneumophila]HAU1208379.1 DUF4949 domain-containing protein [Legionella pneumophila]HAU1284971.1 DUF4949 domain-containing protein [Legionella pneumophila]HAU1960771.1 DUF4949 domain-containing protein [Legionella pneumophila]
MKLKIINAILFLSLSQFSFAAPHEKPNSCPSVSGLQAVGISEVVQEDGLWYGTVKSNNYDTNDKWTFAIGAFKATDENDAKQQALRALNSLTFETGPVAFNVEGQDRWVCLYKDSFGHSAGTITPVMPYLRSLVTHH